jgi:hypothetical protein
MVRGVATGGGAMSFDLITVHDARLETEIYINLHQLSSVYRDKTSGYVVVATTNEKHYVVEDLDTIKRLMRHK